MAKIDFVIEDLIALAKHIDYQPAVANAVNAALSAKTEIEYQSAIEEATSLVSAHREFGSDQNSFLGLPVFLPLTLESYKAGVSDLLLESAVVHPQRAKNIVETELQGRDETVKEFINNGSYQISISGILCNPRIGYPMDQVETLAGYFDHKGSIGIVHELLNTLGINEIVITTHDLPKTPFINCQPYRFTASSDKPIELLIDET